MAAAKKPPRPKAAPVGALKLEDLDPEGQRAVKENWASMGSRMREHHTEALQKAQEGAANPNLKPIYQKKQAVRAKSLGIVTPHLEDKPLTVEHATAGRVRRTHQARERAVKEGPQTDPHTGWEMPNVPRGTGWYFDHHAQIRAAATEHGIDPQKAIVATTAMSPQNDPETERKAGRAMMDMVANQDKHTVHVTPEVHKAMKTSGEVKDAGVGVPDHWLGKHVRLADMHASHIAAIGSKNAELREAGTPVQSTANFADLGAARNATQATKAIGHLRGHLSEEQVIDPYGAPKVWSYKESTKRSVPGSDTHLEYIARAADYQRGGKAGVEAGRETPSGFRPEAPEERTQRRTEQARSHIEQARTRQEQGAGSVESRMHAMTQSLSGIQTRGRGARQRSTLPDIRPERQSDEGALSPEAHTAEDTWMHSISTRQKPDIVRGPDQPGGSGTSIAKMAASDPHLASEKRMTKTAESGATVSSDPRIKNAALNHALNNYATRKAAHRVGMPAQFTQEVPWTEQRIRAEKDPEYKREMAQRSLPKQPPPLSRQFPGAPSNPVTPLHHAAAKALYDRTVSGGSVGQHEVEHVQSLRRNANG